MKVVVYVYLDILPRKLVQTYPWVHFGSEGIHINVPRPTQHAELDTLHLGDGLGFATEIKAISRVRVEAVDEEV